MGAWRRQHKNFSNRPETFALGISPGEGEPSREFGGECLSKSFRSHRGCTRKCNRFSSDPSHPAQQDVTTKKRYSPLPSTILSILSELSRPSEVGSVGFCKPQVGGSIPLASSIQLNLQPRGFEGDVSPSWGACEGAGPLCRSR
jgi:hypothetical protein